MCGPLPQLFKEKGGLSPSRMVRVVWPKAPHVQKVPCLYDSPSLCFTVVSQGRPESHVSG